MRPSSELRKTRRQTTIKDLWRPGSVHHGSFSMVVDGQDPRKK